MTRSSGSSSLPVSHTHEKTSSRGSSTRSNLPRTPMPAWAELIRYWPPRRASTAYAVSGRCGHHQAARPADVVQAAHTR